MKKSEALSKMIHFYYTLPDDLSLERKLELILNFQEMHLGMRAPPLDQTEETAYIPQWESETEIELHDPWIEKESDF